MLEVELRAIVTALREELDEVVDPTTATRLRDEIDRALGAEPGDEAKRRLRRVLTSDPRVLAWSRARTPTRRDDLRVLPHLDLPFADGFDRGSLYSEVRGDEPVVVEGGGGPDEAMAAAPVRHLIARMPERVGTGRTLSLIVQIASSAPAGVVTAPLVGLDVPPGGATVTVIVSSPGLAPRDDVEHDVLVPATGDSEPVRFGFLAERAGRHTVTVDAYRGGTHLGAVRLEVSVEEGASPSEGRTRYAELSTVAFEPGEMTLQVSRGPGGYTFQLLGDPICLPVPGGPIGDVDGVVADLASELSAMAAKASAFGSPALIRRRLENLGVRLWSTAIPEAVREQFWEQADRVTSLSIAADHDAIPWELLYPLEENRPERGFLVEQFPVVRRSYAQRRVSRLPIGSAAYVVPPRSPENALAEIDAVRRELGAGIDDRGVISGLAELDALLTDVSGVLHVACHNTFTDKGSVITLQGGPWRPDDLARAVATRAFAGASPLVFLNACRTAGETEWLGAPTGWASSFIAAGAGAFIGSLWAVRSSSALAYAEAFYEQFVTNQVPLGQASLLARRAVGDDQGDPTWLAYTVYGNPAARAVRPGEHL